MEDRPNTLIIPKELDPNLDPDIKFLGTLQEHYNPESGFPLEIKEKTQAALEKYGLLDEKGKVRYSRDASVEDLCKWDVRDSHGILSFSSRMAEISAKGFQETDEEFKSGGKGEKEAKAAEDRLIALGGFVNSIISIKNLEIPQEKQVAPIMTKAPNHLTEI